MDDIILKHEKHAIRGREPGSWFRPQQWWVKGHRIFFTDIEIRTEIQKYGSLPSASVTLKDGNYEIPLDEIRAAERARIDFLNKKCAAANRKIEAENRYVHRGLLRFSGDIVDTAAGLTARFNCGGALLDYNLDELKDFLNGKDLDVFDPTPMTPVFPEQDLIRAIGVLKGHKTYRTAKGPELRMAFYEYHPDREQVEFYGCEKGRMVITPVRREQVLEMIAQGTDHFIPGAVIDEEELFEALRTIKQHSPATSDPHP